MLADTLAYTSAVTLTVISSLKLHFSLVFMYTAS